MPRILSHTPGWLSRPSPGFNVFAAPPHKITPPVMRDAPLPSAPSRLIARRGTQIFVAVDNEVRWTDLMLLKDFEEQSGGRRSARISPESIPESIYRVVKMGSGISGRITQLSISPFGDYMAVTTSHTVHIVVLHHHDHYELDITPSALKTFHLGPSQHVLERAPLVSALWHPLSPSGRCLVTVTADAVVRLWELNHENRITFQQCDLSLDLGRLANADSADESLSASEFGRGASYMPDSAYLQPTAASFGGTGRAGENPWSAMTLWVTTREGDMYALCPLLPSKFRACPGFLRNLQDSLTAKREEFDEEASTFEMEIEQLRQQEEWLDNLKKIDLVTFNSPDGRLIDALTRPTRPDPVPLLQGPFELGIWEPNITDILVRDICLGEEPIELDTGEYLEDEDDEEIVPLNNAVFLLLSETGNIHVLLGISGVEGRWFTGSQIGLEEPEDSPILHLTTFLSHQPTAVVRQNFRPSFTPDPMSQYSFFVNNVVGVSHFSLEPWVERLKDELENPSDVGADFRAELFAKNITPSVDQLIKFPVPRAAKPSSEISACLAILDEDLGYMILTCLHGEPAAVTLDTKHREVALNVSTASLCQSSSKKWSESQRLDASLKLPITRAPYTADNRFWETSNITRFLKDFPSRAKIPLSHNYELTADTMDAFIQAHQAFSRESQELSEAAADIFLACHRMLDEYHDQLRTLREVSSQVDTITGHDEDEVFGEDIDEDHGQRKLSQRIESAKERQAEIMARAKEVSRKLGRLGGGTITGEKQKAFTAEVDALASQLGLAEKSDTFRREDEVEEEESFSEPDGAEFERRVDEVKALSKEIADEAKHLSHQNRTASPRRQRVPLAMRKEKMEHVKELLDMESSILEATTGRLSRLSLHI